MYQLLQLRKCYRQAFATRKVPSTTRLRFTLRNSRLRRLLRALTRLTLTLTTGLPMRPPKEGPRHRLQRLFLSVSRRTSFSSSIQRPLYNAKYPITQDGHDIYQFTLSQASRRSVNRPRHRSGRTFKQAVTQYRLRLCSLKQFRQYQCSYLWVLTQFRPRRRVSVFFNLTRHSEGALFCHTSPLVRSTQHVRTIRCGRYLCQVSVRPSRPRSV